MELHDVRKNPPRVRSAPAAGLRQLLQPCGSGVQIVNVCTRSALNARVDTLVDKLLDERIQAAREDRDTAAQERLGGLMGKAAVGNARLTYARFRKVFASERFARLKALGASEQRPLWASTSVKNPAYRDVRYVEDLIGPETVNTLPLETIRAFQNHGTVSRTVHRGVEDARLTLRALAEEAGLDFGAVTQQLEAEGVALFTHAYDELIAGVDKKRQEMRGLS